MNKMQAPLHLVSVVMITYMHEDYIKQAVESILMQECNFTFELIVADDLSPDATPLVMDEIIRTHPKGNLINYTRHAKNKGMTANFLWAILQAKGKYIAICEGDDYWTDPLKLQKQVDLLEKDEQMRICFTAVTTKKEKDGITYFSGSKTHKKFILRDFMRENYAFTLTVVFRNEAYDYQIMKTKRAPFTDWLLYNIILKTGGYAFYIPESTGVYRIHGKNSDFHDSRSYKAKLYDMNRIFIKLHGIKYFPFYIRRIYLNIKNS